MTEISSQNQIYPVINGVPVNNPQHITTAGGQSVSIQPSNVTYPYYQYPTASVYDPNQKQAASGVNIYIYNPSAIGGPTSSSVANANYLPNGGVQPQPPVYRAFSTTETPLPQQPIANTPIMTDNNNTVNVQAQSGKTKNVINLTNEYIKTLESYLRSADKNVRKNGIVDLIKRFEEDSSRYNNPALTALLNIALQDPDANNRVLAMTCISSENACGDNNTIKLLQELQKSNKIYGQEAKSANEALLKAGRIKSSISA